MILENIKIGKETLEVHGFDSVAEQVAWSTSVPSVLRHERLVNKPEQEDFTGRLFRDWKHIATAANEAWSEGLAILDDAREQLRDLELPQPMDRRRRPRFDEQSGDDVDYDRLRSGQAYWRRTERQHVAGPIDLTILVDICANGNVKSQDIIWRGVAAIALAEVMEASGYRVELIAVERSRKGYTDGAGFLQYVTLKKLDEQLDATSLINATSGWFFRTIGFAGMVRSGFGRTSELSFGSHAFIGNAMEHITAATNVVVIDSVWNKLDAVELIRNTLEAHSGVDRSLSLT